MPRLFPGLVLLLGLTAMTLSAAESPAPINLALVAGASTSFNSGDAPVDALNDNHTPKNSADNRLGSYGNWPRTGTQWVQYEWSHPIATNRVEVYWWADGRGIAPPKSCRVLYWNGSAFVPVPRAEGLGVERNRFNTTTFDEVTTSRLRLEAVSDGKFSTGILEWRVLDSGQSPPFPPTVGAGLDRSVLHGGRTNHTGFVGSLLPAGSTRLSWSLESGPGEVVFENPAARETTATFASAGDYVLKLTATEGALSASSTVRVRAVAPPPASRLDVVYTKPYAVAGDFWKARTKALIVNWIPHCIVQCERTDLTLGQGGLDNFIEAAKALRGEPHAKHQGYVFSNAWVHQTIEAICIALMVDPEGDPEIIAAQAGMRATLEKWIPIVLAAQEPDGYLHTAYTLADRKKWPEKWSAAHRADHEGYVAGYFIESAINHYTLTNGKDLRLYHAAKKLADCWAANIGPGKKEWYDGHQQMEQALVRFGRFVNDQEGHGRGDAYVTLARFLLDSRKGGESYDQSHLPPIKQYDAVGHAVRATYHYSAMADIAAETHDLDYGSAVMSLWDNLVNRKYYVTGGIGSGETSEGFGPDYSLPNSAYCESCSSCGLIFFQYKLNLAYHDAKYADLYEETMYNALLGATDLDGKVFNYTNPLVDGKRAAWHVCPCCVGNIPRTLLMLPTWTYVKDADGLYVNLFVGGRTRVENVAGTEVEMVQKTDYPWDGKVSITVNPAKPTVFTLRVRVPNRKTSELYTSVPEVSGLKSFVVNGLPLEPEIVKGYATVTRLWTAGDRVDLEFPLAAQRVTADDKIKADRGKVALRYGPLIYNVERADQPDLSQALSGSALTPEWRGHLLGGVVALTGTWADGQPMLAIPHYARMNRTSSTATTGENGPKVNYAPGTAAPAETTSAAPAPAPKPGPGKGPASAVWMKDGR